MGAFSGVGLIGQMESHCSNDDDSDEVDGPRETTRHPTSKHVFPQFQQ